jgi:hypothetical protein
MEESAMDEIEVSQQVNGHKPIEENDTIRVETPSPPPQKTLSAPSSSLTSLGSTPSVQDFGPGSRPVGVYTDVVPANKPFWVEVNPKDETFDRNAFTLDEEEITIVWIISDKGEGDDISYEVQFEDDRVEEVNTNMRKVMLIDTASVE